MPSGGKIEIQARVEDRMLKVSVKDTGIGIPNESMSRISERFYRIDKARSREMGGTGLGLPIVKHAIEKNSGLLEVTSDVGEGSTFTFGLPVR